MITNNYYIYYIQNNLNNKFYIGYTKNFEARIKQHKIASTYIGNTIRKYNLENFTFQKICKLNSKKEVCEIEIFLIQEFKTFFPFGYNITNGGDGGNTFFLLSEEKKNYIRTKVSLAHKNKIVTDETKKRQSEAIKKYHEEVTFDKKEKIKNKISNTLLGHKRSEQSKIKQGNTWKNGKNSKKNIERIQKLGELQKIKFSKEQESFIREKRNEGFSYIKICKALFENFNIKVSKTVIQRILNTSAYDNSFSITEIK
jgi:predicted GIY-YIG superfamily endonuclease